MKTKKIQLNKSKDDYKAFQQDLTELNGDGNRSRGRYGEADRESWLQGASSRRFTILPAVSLNAGDIKTLAAHARGESIVID